MTEPGQASAAPAGAPHDPLSALEREAGAFDAELAGAVGDEPGPQGAGPARQAISEELVADNRAIFGMLVAMASPAFPFLPTAYTPEVIDQIARAYSAVEVKRGWNLGGLIGPEGALAITALPPTLLAITLGREHFRALREQREREARAAYERERGAPDAPRRAAAPGATTRPAPADAASAPAPIVDPSTGTYRVM